jgi:integrase
MRERINERLIRRLRENPPKAGVNGQTVSDIVWDSDPKGFGVRITSGGALAFILRYVLDGRERRMTIGAYPDLSPSAAREEAVRLRGLIVAGQDPLADREDRRRAPTVDQLCTRYVQEHLRVHNKPSTIEGFERLVEAHIRPKLGAIKARALSRDDVARFHRGMAETPRQANQALAVLSKMMRCAEAWGLRPDGSNPCRLVKRFPEVKRERFYSDTELQAIGAAISELLRDGEVFEGSAHAIFLLAFTGCRTGEILGLRWADVNLGGGYFMIRDGKTGDRRQVIGESQARMFKHIQQKHPGEWVVWSADNHKPLSYWTLEGDWRRIRERAKLHDARLHDLRHTVGTYAAGIGANAFQVRDLLGHRTMAMTGRYVGKDTSPLLALSDSVGKRIGNALLGRPAPANESTDAGRKVG